MVGRRSLRDLVPPYFCIGPGFIASAVLPPLGTNLKTST